MAKSDDDQMRLFQEKLVPADPKTGMLFETAFEGKSSGPVTCLGRTFENDEARRSYFTEELRKQLLDPEFRKIEGFPIGSDEDILAISDPPYYTACPNPFIPDFIKQYGKPYNPQISYKRAPFASDITEGKNDPIYDAHPYHTKVPPRALMRLLLHYTDPGDVVLDAFSGSGMLGVAASLCQDPASHLESFTGSPGTRFAILSDISPLATSIANVNSRPNATANTFGVCADAVWKSVRVQYSWMYKTVHSSKGGVTTMGEIIYCIWSDFYECPNCSKPIRAWDAIVDRSNTQLRKAFDCPFCQTHLEKETLTRVTETYYDSLLCQPCKRNKTELVWIHYKVGSSRFEKAPDAADLALLSRIDAEPFPAGLRPIKMNFRDPPWGDLYRSGYHSGVTHAHHFFTKRNLITLGALRNSAVKSNLPQQMLFALTGFVDNHASKRNRYLIDRHHETGTTCGPLSNSLYIPELQCEVNPFNTWNKTIKKQKASFAVSRPASSVLTTEASRLSQIPDKTVDYVFVDPPFGENIFYSESSFCWEYFIGVFTNAQSEAIISKYHKKAIVDYRKLIGDVFAQCYRVLKPGRWMTVEFSNRSNAVWNALSEAIQVAGFIIADVRVFDKKHGTIRQDMGQSIKKDLIISVYRPNGGLEDRFATEAGTTEGVWDFVRTHLYQLPVIVVDANGKAEIMAERLGHVLFDRMVAFHVQRGIQIPLSASAFALELPRRFSEKDGMYFMPEQLAEYDRRRLTVKEVLQLQFFVTDESSAIQWLKQQIVKTPQTFQELHAQFIKETNAWQRHETPLELLDLLRENFLIYDGLGPVPSQIHSYLSTNWPDMRNKSKDDTLLRSKAKDRWYVPDPNKAGDLEKLREKALLKEFEEYKAAKKKLKVFRLEAVRAGFKALWQQQTPNAYRIIKEVAEKIPGDILEEDPKLLMWYDTAVTRLGGE